MSSFVAIRPPAHEAAKARVVTIGMLCISRRRDVRAPSSHRAAGIHAQHSSFEADVRARAIPRNDEAVAIRATTARVSAGKSNGASFAITLTASAALSPSVQRQATGSHCRVTIGQGCPPRRQLRVLLAAELDHAPPVARRRAAAGIISAISITIMSLGSSTLGFSACQVAASSRNSCLRAAPPPLAASTSRCRVKSVTGVSGEGGGDHGGIIPINPSLALITTRVMGHVGATISQNARGPWSAPTVWPISSSLLRSIRWAAVLKAARMLRATAASAVGVSWLRVSASLVIVWWARST